MKKIPVRSYSSYEMIEIIKADGWKFKNCEGDHYHFIHPAKPGKVTITHPVKNLPKKRVASILRQAGLR
ncbi:MAG: type II toxin-antitoxin system HicA family toxin [Synergistaceae bacterium]|nr:type II toxin-antitoxin system HicA family toxin [Synergistaceae bacterium]